MQKISEVMNTDVQTISPDATIEEAALQMRDGDFGVLPVGETENLIGIITDRDIVESWYRKFEQADKWRICYL